MVHTPQLLGLALLQQPQQVDQILFLTVLQQLVVAVVVVDLALNLEALGAARRIKFHLEQVAALAQLVKVTLAARHLVQLQIIHLAAVAALVRLDRTLQTLAKVERVERV